jgi:type IV pilus assembly protein PilV
MNAAPKACTLRSAYPQSRGLTLVEILIALLVLSIGLLGLAGLQTMSLKFNTSAYYRTQATALAYDFADRMRANRQAALAGAYTLALQDPPPPCAPAAAGATVAEDDIAVWRAALACRIPRSTGAVALDGSEVTITVQWADSEGDDDMSFQFTTAL